MKKPIFITSVFGIFAALPAFAANVTGSGNECVVGTLGVDSGSASIEALWTANQYSEPAGQYLLFSNGTITQHVTCPAGYYCEGFEDETFADESIGLYSCDNETDGEFPNSDSGISAINLCYVTGTVACAQLNKYTGGHGTANYANVNASYRAYGDYGTPDDLDEDYPSGYSLDTVGACAITSLNCDSGYHQENGGPLANYVYHWLPWEQNQNIKYRALNGDSGSNSGNDGRGSHAGMANGEWSITWPDNTTIHGMAKCSSTGGSYAAVGNPENTEGSNCWCDMTGYNLTGGSLVSVASPAWVFFNDRAIASNCVDFCANYCANYAQLYSAWRVALFGALGANPSCSANIIDLDWNPTNGEEHTQNQCTYDGQITLPTEPSKTGYTFGGWSVVSGN